MEKFPNAPMRSDEFKLSIIHNKERGRKISESHIGKPSDMLGKHHTLEAKKKIGDAQRGDKNSSKRPEVRKKLSERRRYRNQHPTQKMIEGYKKVSKTLTGRTKENYEYLQCHSERLTGRTKENYEYRRRQGETYKKICENPTPAMIEGHKKCGKKLRGRKRSFMVGDKNPMKRPNVLKKYAKTIKAKPNKGEKALYSILQTILPNEYKINVKADIMTLGGKIPDFVNVNGSKKIIEFNGDYWHTEEESQQIADYFKRYGWDTLFIWEHEMKDKNTAINKICRFHNLPSELLSKQLTLD